MSRRYIDFISAYCDSWCERCHLTERCSHFALTSALAMCDGNYTAATELAIGPARVPGARPQATLEERMAEALVDFEPSEKELDEIGRELAERERRVERFEIAQASHDYAIGSHRWLMERHHCNGHRDPAVLEAIATVGWDSFLIHVKIKRALNGRDEYPSGAPFEKSAVQSDWNGSAKVALLSVERSEPAWRILAATLTDEAAGVLADALAGLRRGLNQEFPRAMEFRRPGFDQQAREV